MKKRTGKNASITVVTAFLAAAPGASQAMTAVPDGAAVAQGSAISDAVKDAVRSKADNTRVHIAATTKTVVKPKPTFRRVGWTERPPQPPK